MPADLSAHLRKASRKVTGDDDLDMRRARGEISCAECRRLKLKCDKKIPCSSCTRRGCPSICPNGSLSSGQGTRYVLADTTHLHAKITEMGHRIRQLEDAIAIFQSGVSTEIHPLLREELLTIKFPPERGAPSDAPDDTSDTIDALGTLTIGDQGAKYYGPSAGTEALFLAGREISTAEQDETPRVPVEITRLSKFPFGVEEDVEGALEIILLYLPVQARAWTLYETFIEHASWMFCPLNREEMVEEIITPIYKAMKERQTSGSKAIQSISPHKLAVLFLLFAIGALVDLTQEAYNAESELYYHLGSACLSLRPVFDSPEIATVQAVLLLGNCHIWGGKNHSIDSGWAIMSFGAKLAQAIGLHRDGARFHMDAKTVRRRRFLFWELFSADIFSSLSVGRPPSIRLSYVDCQFPEDDEASLDDKGNVCPGFDRWKYEFMRDIISKVTDLTLTPKVQYQAVLDLDRKVREKPLPAYLNSFLGSEACSPLVYLRKCLLANYRASTLMFIHRSFFAQAMIDFPANPLRSPYAPSFLAAYRCSSGVIKSTLYHFERFPDLTCRTWGVWTILFPAAIIVGSVVTRSPASSMAPNAFIELGLVIDLFEKGALQSRRARDGLAILVKLKEKAYQAYSQHRTGNPAPGTLLAGKANLADDELALFGGQTQVIVSKLLSKPPPKGSQPQAPSPPLSTSSGGDSVFSQASAERMPDVHPALVEYLSTFPPELAGGSPDMSLFSPGYVQRDVPTDTTFPQHDYTAQDNPNMQFAWPPPPSHPTTAPPDYTSPQIPFETYVPFMQPSEFGMTQSKGDLLEGNVFDFEMMPSTDTGMDEQWMTFMRDTGLFDGSLNGSGLYGMTENMPSI